jgi:hypothetical protein
MSINCECHKAKEAVYLHGTLSQTENFYTHSLFKSDLSDRN